jgi:iron complex outermembrane receptor protein
MLLTPRPSSLRRALVLAVLAALATPSFADEAQGDDPAAKADTTELGKVVVTAQSRNQEVQDVPIALQIVDAKQISTLAATDLSKMSLFIPGLVVTGDQPTQPSYQLRGISTADFGVGTDSAVGVYVDGVYAARSGGALLAFNDIKRIEVLKGPQGTLFGRNSAAGAISLITNEPSDKVEGRARLRIGNYGKEYVDALLNLPVSDMMAFRFSVLDNQSDGWLRDATSGRKYGADDDWGTRAAWRWNLSSDTRVLVSWDHERLNQLPKAAIGLIPLTSDPQQRPPFPADPSTFLNPIHAPLNNDAMNPAETRRFDGVTFSVDHNFGAVNLVSTTAWRDFDTLNRGDYDGTNHIVSYLDTANIESNTSLYQEFKFSGTTDRIDWVAGASWNRERAHQTSQTNIFTDGIDTLALNLSPAPTPDGTLYGFLTQVLAANGLPYSLVGLPWGEAIHNQGTFQSTALFGDVIWHLNDRWNLTTGVRFTRDSKTFSWYNQPRSADELDAILAGLQQAGVLDQLGIPIETFQQNLIFTDAVGVPVQFHDTWNDVSPRVVLDTHFTPDAMGYVSATKGYKAGGYNSVQVGSRFEPEKVWNVEAGVKSVFPDQHLLLDASVYHYNYSNRQALTLDPNTAGSGIPRYLVDSSDQKASGVEFEAQWQPSEAWRLNFSGAWIDSTYGHKTSLSGAELSGEPTGEPHWSFAAGLSYIWQNIAGGNLQFDVQHAYRGESRCNSDSVLQGNCQISPNFDVDSAQQRTDARLGWTSGDGRWGVAAYVNNAFDKRYVTGVSNISATVFGTPYASINPPRFYGAEVQVNF